MKVIAQIETGGAHKAGPEILSSAGPGNGSLAQSSYYGAIFEGGTAVMAGSALGNGLNYFFMMFLARQLGMEEFGLYALGVTIFNTLILLATTGFDSGVVKFISERLAFDDQPAARRMVAVAWLIAAGLGVLACLVLAMAATPLASGIYGRPGLALPLLLFAAAVPFAFSTVLLLSSLQAYRTVRYTILVKYLWEPLGKWGIAGLALMAGWGVAGVVGAFVVTFMVSAVFAAVALVRVAHLSIRDVVSVQKDDVRALVIYCLPLLAANVFGVLAPRADMMILGYWVSSHDVGLYLAAFQTAAILALILGAFDVVFAPAIGRAWAAKDRLMFQGSYEAVHRIAFTATVPLCVLLVSFADEFLSAFGRGFESGGSILAILVIGHLVNASSGCANTVLLMSGHPRVVLGNTVVYGTILIGATAAMIPLWGPVGAAIAASGSFVLLNGLRVVQVWRVHRMLPWTWAIVKPLAAGSAMALTIWLAKPHLAPVGYVSVGLVACGLYVAVLRVARFEAEDALILSALAARVRVAAGWAR